MSVQFDATCLEAVNRAKRGVADHDVLTIGLLMSALYYVTELKDEFPDLAEYLSEPPVLRDAPGVVPLSDELKPVMGKMRDLGREVSARELFAALLETEAGRRELQQRGVDPGEILSVLKPPPAAVPWRQSSERETAVKALASFGRLLTDGEPPDRGRSELEESVKALVMTLSKMKRRNAIVVGYPGTGKTALIYELARRIVKGDQSIPQRLRDYDIFELSPTFLRSGASVVGQYEERVKALIEVLTAHPRIILFIDEVHSMFQSGMHSHGPFSDANESFKGVLGRGDIICIGCTTLSEYKHYIEPDPALTRRFDVIRIQPPSRETTLRILRSRLPRVEKHYAPLRVSDEVLEHVIQLSQDYLPARFEPDRSIQLLDQACAWMTVENAGSSQLTSDAVTAALEHTLGHEIVRTDRLTEEDVFQRLQAKIKGQDSVLHDIAQAFVSGLGSWANRSGPRGVYLFGGPTGVGKTETAQQLGEILGGDRDALIRVDCNLFQGVGNEAGPIRNLLLGVPGGYVGYSRGQGGILSRIRDEPETVILFDEIEKAGPSVTDLLLNIIDEGKAEDVDGNVLDFRRSYMIFTTNAGADYEEGRLGFLASGPNSVPTINREQLEQELMGRLGVGYEFLGRLSHIFLFRGLTRDVMEQIVTLQLERLSHMAELRGKHLSWENDVAEHLAAFWQPRFGVRYLTAILRNRILEQLGMAEAAGELDAATKIRLRQRSGRDEGMVGLATRELENGTLFITIA